MVPNALLGGQHCLHVAHIRKLPHETTARPTLLRSSLLRTPLQRSAEMTNLGGPDVPLRKAEVNSSGSRRSSAREWRPISTVV